MCKFKLTSLAALIALTIGVATAGAAPITCTDSLVVGGQAPKLFSGTVDPAISCIGPFVGNDAYPLDLTAFGFTWLAQDKDAGAPENGATEDAFSVVGVGLLEGTFTIDPAETQCGLVDCNYFVVALKWDGVFAYWNLGQITSPTTFDWEVDPNEDSHASLYGRSGITQLPEPAMLFLFGLSVFGIGRRFRRTS